ncbi:hypothetical protein NIB75_08475 [Bacteroides uniformis]|nr:hypothetical protein [Bacteroides uniformis]
MPCPKADCAWVVPISGYTGTSPTWEAYGAYDNKARIPAQHICNADITYSWRRGRYNLALECTNFLDKTAYDNYKLQKPGRAFFAKFRLFIN